MTLSNSAPKDLGGAAGAPAAKGVPLARIAPEKSPRPDSAEAAVNTVLARMVNLSQAAMRAENPQKAAEIIVNRAHTLVKTDRAVLVPLAGNRRILAVSGDLEPSQDNPFSQAVQEARKLYRGAAEPAIISSEELPKKGRAAQLSKILESTGGTTILWLPLPGPGNAPPSHALWLERWNQKPWTPEEIRLVTHALPFLGHALAGPRPSLRRSLNKRRVLILSLVLVALLMFLPVHSKVQAPIQIMPQRPHYVFAPFDGILEELAVFPGDRVAPGDLLFRYDTRVLRKEYEEAQRSLASAMAELARLEGAGYLDEEARAKIPVQKIEVERWRDEVAFLDRQLQLSDVHVDAEGMVVLDDPDALIGASLRTGEMVLRVADPQRTKVRAMVPVADVGLVREGAEARIRLDSDPLNSRSAVVERVGFDVQLSDEQVPSVLVELTWTEEGMVSPGQRGSAKILGEETIFGMHLFRKTLMNLRDFLGV